MGAGKSTIGPLLARILSWDFVEMDRLIEKAIGLSVSEIFKERGEPFFREEEARVARSLAGREKVVIATGGGAFAQPGTREVLAEGAFIVWLKAPFDTLSSRVDRGPSRPLALDRATMQKLWEERDPFYRQADFVVETADTTPAAVARQIAERIQGGRPES